MILEKELSILKEYFEDTEVSEEIKTSFYSVYASMAIPKHTWIEHKGLSKPIILEGWFGVIQFRDGEKRTVNLDTLPCKLWIHTEEPEVMSKNSCKRRADWNNQIVAYYIHEI